MKNIEIEVRGPLSTDQYQSALTFLKEHGKYVETKNRILLDYSTMLEGEGVEDRTRDIRLRVTNEQPEIITKVGKWGGKEVRKELSVKTFPGTFDTLVETYAVLGYTKAMLCVRNTEVFIYKDIEFALVEVPGHSYYFEAEKTASDDMGSEAVHTEIEAVCTELELTLFSDTEFYTYIETLNREANEVFDFSNYEDGYFAQRFDLGV